MKVVTASKDKEKYGLKLKADLDFQRLGRRLKEDFKKVQEAIKSKFLLLSIYSSVISWHHLFYHTVAWP